MLKENKNIIIYNKYRMYREKNNCRVMSRQNKGAMCVQCAKDSGSVFCRCLQYIWPGERHSCSVSLSWPCWSRDTYQRAATETVIGVVNVH